MSEFNFKSQVCTDRVQSERLLALGLKKETADMVYRSFGYIIDEFGNKERRFKQPTVVVEDWESKYDIPAWSLHRLIEMIPMYFKETKIEIRSEAVKMAMKDGELYNNLIDIIADCIKTECFNKEYLEETL